VNLSIEHADVVEAASKSFWDACRVDLGRAVLSMQEPWREPMEEFEKVREAVRKGMRAAMETANKMQRGDLCVHDWSKFAAHPRGGYDRVCRRCGVHEKTDR
jgi:hypothetical protein